eukprot:CAMPEP_0171102886 /NCGR_PEP_ID=MMETSP0766_2-20121228/58613_1 /TAXON_ID=439317 /ORGANISM="Gambierdiscus australes, Strain CAWD 149" /LENGTH=168 /DNA_ID=CAMNT_0011563259 /DNA_START=110 /DNA_END=616 /DNA_ORIENTATION=+
MVSQEERTSISSTKAAALAVHLGKLVVHRILEVRLTSAQQGLGMGRQPPGEAVPPRRVHIGLVEEANLPLCLLSLLQAGFAKLVLQQRAIHAMFLLTFLLLLVLGQFEILAAQVLLLQAAFIWPIFILRLVAFDLQVHLLLRHIPTLLLGACAVEESCCNQQDPQVPH